MSGEFSRAPMVARLGRSLAEVYPLRPVALVWRSARPIRGWSWRLWKGTEGGFGGWGVWGGKKGGVFCFVVEGEKGSGWGERGRRPFFFSRYASVPQTIT